MFISAKKGTHEEFEQFGDFDEPDLASLHMDQLYKQTSATAHSIYSRDSFAVVEDITKKLISGLWNAVYEAELNKKAPAHSLIQSLEATEKTLSIALVEHDNSTKDFLTKGLYEDEEPLTTFQDAWLRAKIHVDSQLKEDDEGE